MKGCEIRTSVRTAVLPALDCVLGLLADVWVCTRALELTAAQKDAAGHDADVGGGESSAAEEQRDEERGEGVHFFLSLWLEKSVCFFTCSEGWS
jgi:hypothetical protein